MMAMVQFTYIYRYILPLLMSAFFTACPLFVCVFVMGDLFVNCLFVFVIDDVFVW